VRHAIIRSTFRSVRSRLSIVSFSMTLQSGGGVILVVSEGAFAQRRSLSRVGLERDLSDAAA
jgi:hypothetical protein